MSVYCQIGTCIDAIYNVLADQLDILDGPNLVISKYELKPAETKVPPRSQYQPIVERDIFQIRTADSVTKIEKIGFEDIKLTERNLKLWGTVVGDGTASAYAIIEEPGTRSRRNRQSLHKPGDVVQGATMKIILREKVILSAEGKNEALEIWRSLSSGGETSVEFNRRGRKRIIDYRIR